MSRDKTCEARGWGAYQSGIEGCHDEWFQREARIARLCMMFMQAGDGVRSRCAKLRARGTDCARPVANPVVIKMSKPRNDPRCGPRGVVVWE